MKTYIKEHWRKLLVMAGAVILLTVLVELLVFNFHSLFDDTYTTRYDFAGGQTYDNVKIEDVDYSTTTEQDGKTVESKGLETDYTFTFPEKMYIKKLHIGYQSPVDFSITMNAYNDNGYGETAATEYYDQSLAAFTDYYNNIGQDATGCKIRVVNNFNGTINFIEFSNELTMNPYRMFFLAVVFSCILFLIFGAPVFGRKLEVYFAFLSLLAGSIYIIFGGTLRIGWDEQVHFDNAYSNAYFSTVQYTEAATIMKEAHQPYYNTLEERQYIADYFNSKDNTDQAVLVSKPRFIPYNQWAYITQTLFLAIGRLLHLPFTILYMFGKFGNLLLYTLVVALAIKYAKVGKAIVAVIALLPTCLFQATCYAYDGVAISFTILGFILWLNEVLDKEKKLKWYNVLAIVGCFVFASLPKAIYIILLGLLCFFPKTKFGSKKQRIFFIAGVVAVMITIIYTFLFPVASQTSMGNVNWGSDVRNEESETGIVKQLMMILDHPWTYTKLLVGTIFKTFCDYIFGIGANANFAFLGAYSAQFTYLFTPLFLGLGFISCQEETKYVLAKKYKLLIGVLVFGVFCLIWTALYLSFTQIGALGFNGVQPRYYLPIMVMLPFLCRNKTLVCHGKLQNYNRIVMAIMTFVVLYGAYSIMLPFNV